MSERFSMSSYTEACREIARLKREHPYVANEWLVGSEDSHPEVNSGIVAGIVGGLAPGLIPGLTVDAKVAGHHASSKEENLAKKTLLCLQKVATEIDALILSRGFLEKGTFKVEACKGVGYFPRNPWIGVFLDGVKASNGVYPIIVFKDDGSGFVVGCTESFSKPQVGFDKYVVAPKDWDPKLGDYDEHFAKGAKFFKVDDSSELDIGAISKALKKAIDIAVEMHQDGAQEMSWCKEIEVDNIESWLELLDILMRDKKSHWVFRGQGIEKWGLESSIGRMLPKGENGGYAIETEEFLVAKEREAVCEFERAAAIRAENKRESRIDYLAMLQHSGGKTRLLDFSFSPYVALYMAQEQHLDFCRNASEYLNRYEEVPEGREGRRRKRRTMRPVSYVVWALNLDIFVDGGEGKDWNSFLIESRKKANDILSPNEGGKADKTHKVKNNDSDSGLLVVLPQVGNDRLSAQEGLFLMQKHFTNTIENIICAELRKERNKSFADSQSVADFKFVKAKRFLASVRNKKYKLPFTCYKFIFNSEEVKDAVWHLLSMSRNGAKYIYPDLTGLAKGIAANFQLKQ